MIELGLADGSLIDELMELTAQSLARLEIQERFDIVKEIGRGKYGKVLLVTHRFRGATTNDKHGKCSFFLKQTKLICSGLESSGKLKPTIFVLLVKSIFLCYAINIMRCLINN